MADHAPRCPFCANVLKLEPSFWEKIGLKSHKTRCPTCQRSCDTRDAHTMGSAFFHWAELFRGELTMALSTLPVLPEPAMHRALGMPHKDDTVLMPSTEELVRTCLRHHRAAIIEMARGHEATLEVAHLNNESSNSVEVLAVLSTASRESGGRERQQVIARRGPNHFVLYNYPGHDGAEPRVKRAIHSKVRAPRSLTDAHAGTHHHAHH